MRNLLPLIFSSMLFVPAAAAEDGAKPELEIHAETRPRLEARFGHHFGKELDDQLVTGNQPNSRDVFSQRTRLGVSLPGEELRARTTIQFAQIWGDEADAQIAPFPLKAYEAWVEYSIRYHLELRAGRFELNYGEGRVVAAPGWNQVGRTWDGVRVRTRLIEDGFVDVWAARNQDGGPGTEFLENDGYFSGIYSSLRMIPGISELDVYLLADTKLSDFESDAAHRKLLGVAGMRLKLGDKKANLVAEGALQAGQICVQDSESLCTSATEDFTGGMFEIEGRYVLGGVLTTYGAISWASEDNDPVYPKVHAHLGWMDFFRRSDLAEAHVGAKFDTGYTQIHFKAHEFWRSDFESRLGTELNLAIGVKPIAGLSFEGGGGLFFADEGMVLDGNPDGTASWLYTTMLWSY